MFFYFKNLWENYRLNHHNCENNYKIIDSYTTSASTKTDSAKWQVVVVKCNICGKRFDID